MQSNLCYKRTMLTAMLRKDFRGAKVKGGEKKTTQRLLQQSKSEIMVPQSCARNTAEY